MAKIKANIDDADMERVLGVCTVRRCSEADFLRDAIKRAVTNQTTTAPAAPTQNVGGNVAADARVTQNNFHFGDILSGNFANNSFRIVLKRVRLKLEKDGSLLLIMFFAGWAAGFFSLLGMAARH